MIYRKAAILLCLVMACIGITACGQQNAPISSTQMTVIPFSQPHAMNYTQLIARLRHAGATVVPTNDVSQPFLDVPGHIVKVNNEQIQVYEYASVSDAYAEASHISPDGSTFTNNSANAGSTSNTVVDWAMPPHFYKKGRVLVIYVGTNNQMLQLLTKVLGAQFAGA